MNVLKKIRSQYKDSIFWNWLGFIIVYTAINLAMVQSQPGSKLIVPSIFFLGLCTFFRPFGAMVFACVLDFVLLALNSLKMANNGMPLEFLDIIYAKQAIAMSNYLSIKLIIAITVSIAGLIFCSFYFYQFKKKFLVFLGFIAMLFTVELMGTPGMQRTQRSIFQFFDMSFKEASYESNLRDRGTLLHLIQTSGAVAIPEGGKHSFYSDLGDYQDTHIEADVFLVLCESCYSSPQYPTAIDLLKEKGFKEGRAYSPIYGGGTAESEFEVITGLSSRVLYGVEYQKYGRLFKEHPFTLLADFKNSNYLTYAFHNYFSYMWSRKQVYAKFGFDKTYFIHDMPTWKGEVPPRDFHLFKTIQNTYDQNIEFKKPLFSFVITMEPHGPYAEEKQDSGEAAYRLRLANSVNELILFRDWLEERSAKNKRPYIMVIFGDHKPALPEVLVRKGVLAEELFQKSLANQLILQSASDLEAFKAIGDVPFFITGNALSDKAQDEFIHRVQEKPLFCLGANVGMMFSNASPFIRKTSAICQQYTINDLWSREGYLKIVPLELYGELLFIDK